MPASRCTLSDEYCPANLPAPLRISCLADADKRGYRDYYETLLKLVRPGGLIALDNVLWYGKVADEQVTDKATVHLRELNAFLMTDSRIDFSIVPIGDGVALCRVKPLVT